MLPDGLHKRKDDWTVFFLNRDAVPSSLSFFSLVSPPRSLSFSGLSPPLSLTEPTRRCPLDISAQ